jgi:hypothetical protein
LRAVLFFFVLGLAPSARGEEYPLPPPPPGQHLDFSAETVDFDGASSTLHLSSNVLVRESTWTLKGQELWIDTERRTGRSEGPLLIDDGVTAVYGESGEFDFGRHSGRLQRTSAGHGDWRITPRDARVGEDRRLEYRGANFTSCSAKPPHYHFRASSMSVVPRKSLVARNVLFYLGGVPVFYTPVLYKSLRKQNFLRWKSQPGYDRRNGPFLKNTLLTEHSASLYSKLYFDYYSAQGLGGGGELLRRESEDARGALFGYGIRETSTNDRRWALLGQQYQALGSSSAAQLRLQLQSDPDFNNHYARSNTFRVTPELVNGGALVRRFKKATARVSYSRQDTAEAGRGRFLKNKESYPRVEIQSVPLGLGRTSWLQTLDGFADNSYDRSRPYLERSLGGGWEVTRTWNLGSGVSLAPKFGLRETYYSRVDSYGVGGGSSTVLDAFVGRWSAEETLRFDTILGGWDVTHSYKRRLKPDSFSDDAGALDKGVEENRVTVSDVFLPAPSVWARLSSGYDFRTFRDRTVGFRRRVQPVVAEVSWSPAPDVSLFAREDYQLDDGNRAALFNVLWGAEDGASVGGGFFHNAADPGRYVANAEFAVAPSSPTWRLALGLRADAWTPGGLGRMNAPRVFEKEIAWTRRWHDFYTKLSARFRPGGVGEASIRIDLKFGAVNPKDAPHRDWETELFPDRARSDDMRP